MYNVLAVILFTALSFLSLAGLICIMLKGYDYLIIKKEIWSREGIGEFATIKEWGDSVRNKAFEWVMNVPPVQVSDTTHFVLLEKLTGKYSKPVLQAWQRGGLVLGLAHYLKAHPKEAEALHIADSLAKDLFDSEYNWKIEPEHIDNAFLAYAVMKLPGNHEQYYSAMEKIVENIMLHIGTDNTVFYRKDISNYRLVDTIGMICPFLVRYGTIYKKPELVDLALKQIQKYIQYGIHPKTHIPAHAYHINSKMPLGIFGWGRGAGWYVLGLVDSFEELPEGHPEKDFLRRNIAILAESLISCQRTDGGWGHSFFEDNNIFDASATAMIIYFLKKALAFNIIETNKYAGAVAKGILKLKQSTRRDGTVDYSQGDTKGIGTYSSIFREFPFTQGITLSVISIS